MHEAFQCFEVLSGLKDKPESILVHSNKLILGNHQGSINVYRLNPQSDETDTTDATSPSKLIESKSDFSKRSIDQLGIIKEANTLVSLSGKSTIPFLHLPSPICCLSPFSIYLTDSVISLHDLTSLTPSSQLTPSSSSTSTLPQTKSALTFSIDTSVQRRPLPPKPPSRFIHRDNLASSNDRPSLSPSSPFSSAGTSNTLGRNNGAYRPTGTLPRQRNPTLSGGKGPDPSWRQSLRGMEDLVREKEEREMRVKEGLQNVSRAGNSGNGGDGEEGIMTLVTVLAVGCRRKVVLFRWVDGEFWDTKVSDLAKKRGDGGMGCCTQRALIYLVKKLSILLTSYLLDLQEISLPHSPRSLAFPTPTSLFLGYSSTDYSILSIPLARSSSVFSNPPQSSNSNSTSSSLLGIGTLVPLNSSTGPRVDTNSESWKVKELNLPSSGASQDDQEFDPKKDHSGTSTAAAQSGGGLGAAFGGLTGYIGLGPKTNKTARSILSIDEGETLFSKEGQTNSFFLNEFGKPSRKEGIEWNGSIPEDLSYAKPYLVAVLPAGTPYDTQVSSENSNTGTMTRSQSLHPSALPKPTGIPSSNSFASWGNYSTSTSNETDSEGPDLRSLIQIRSSSTLVPVQTFPFPPNSSTSSHQLHHLTSSPGSKPPFFLISTPTDRALLEKKGSSIWKFEMKSWNLQIEELVSKGEWTEALRLIEGIDERMLGLGIGKKLEKTRELRTLHGLELFKMGKFEEAIDVFTELELNPCKVLCLFPKEISGDLCREKDSWEEIVGGRKRSSEERIDPEVEVVKNRDEGTNDSSIGVEELPSTISTSTATSSEPQGTSSVPIPSSSSSPETPIPSPSPSQPQARPRERSRFTSLLSGGLRPSSMIFGDHVQIKDKDAGESGSIRSVKTVANQTANANSDNEATNRKALDALGRFLADRRRIFMPLLESSDPSDSIPLQATISSDDLQEAQPEITTEQLLEIPSLPLTELDPKDLKEIAIVVDTALFKTFLKTKPGLIGPLCRVRNWCKVEEVEGVLEERKVSSRDCSNEVRTSVCD